jgi:hypothetical protein
MAYVSILPFHTSPTSMGYRKFPENSSLKISPDLLRFLSISMIHRLSTIYFTMCSFCCSNFFDAENKRVGHNFSFELFVKMPSSF